MKLAIFLAIGAILAFETGAVIWAKFQAQDIADAAAVEAAARFRDTRSADIAMTAAESLIADRDSGAKLRAFEVQRDGTVSITVRRRASTFIVQHIGFLEGFRAAQATGEATPPTI